MVDVFLVYVHQASQHDYDAQWAFTFFCHSVVRTNELTVLHQAVSNMFTLAASYCDIFFVLLFYVHCPDLKRLLHLALDFVYLVTRIDAQRYLTCSSCKMHCFFALEFCLWDTSLRYVYPVNVQLCLLQMISAQEWVNDTELMWAMIVDGQVLYQKCVI